MYESKITESNYHAFGSDDMFQSERPQKKTLADRLETSKQVFGKIGTFFSNSMKNIVSHKDTEPRSDLEQIDREDEEPHNKDKRKHKDIGKDIKSISSKIGEGIVNIGSKTKTLATQAGTFVKQKTNTMFRKEHEEIHEEPVKEGVRYQQYFDYTGDGDGSGRGNGSKKGSKSEEGDVHFI